MDEKIVSTESGIFSSKPKSIWTEQPNERTNERTNVPEINFLMIFFFSFSPSVAITQFFCNHEKGTSVCNNDIRHAHWKKFWCVRYYNCCVTVISTDGILIDQYWKSIVAVTGNAVILIDLPHKQWQITPRAPHYEFLSATDHLEAAWNFSDVIFGQKKNDQQDSKPRPSQLRPILRLWGANVVPLLLSANFWGSFFRVLRCQQGRTTRLNFSSFLSFRSCN